MSDVFRYNRQVFGGTEYMASAFHEKVLPYVPKFKDYNCFVIPGITLSVEELKKSNKEIIIWFHNILTQFDTKLVNQFFTPEIKNKIKYVVVLSEYHKKEIIKFLNIEESKLIVIPNAINPLKYNASKFEDIDTVRIVHTSGPDRGLEILVKAAERLSDNFIIEVYNDYYPELSGKITDDPRFIFYGKTPKETVMKAVERAHIHAYPSTYLETFCLSQVEAFSAGCLSVTSDCGALSEVSKEHGIMYGYEPDKQKHIQLFSEKLKLAIDKIKNKEFNPEKQIEFANSEYSWDRHKEHWLKLHDKL